MNEKSFLYQYCIISRFQFKRRNIIFSLHVKSKRIIYEWYWFSGEKKAKFRKRNKRYQMIPNKRTIFSLNGHIDKYTEQPKHYAFIITDKITMILKMSSIHTSNNVCKLHRCLIIHVKRNFIFLRHTANWRFTAILNHMVYLCGGVMGHSLTWVTSALVEGFVIGCTVSVLQVNCPT